MTGAMTMDSSHEKGAGSGLRQTAPVADEMFVNRQLQPSTRSYSETSLKQTVLPLKRNNDPWANVPLVVSISSTATGQPARAHRLGNLLAPFAPVSRVVVPPASSSIAKRLQFSIHLEYPSHSKIRQSEVYTTTPEPMDI